jgi:hypothetical protein
MAEMSKADKIAAARKKVRKVYNLPLENPP